MAAAVAGRLALFTSTLALDLSIVTMTDVALL